MAVIKLDKDYIYDKVLDSNLNGKIIINKPLTIDGQGHIINGKTLSSIFSINNNQVILKNIIFQNGKHSESGYGGVIYWTGNNGIIINSTFIYNSAGYGGAIYWSGANGIIINSSFINNNATTGTAIYNHDLIQIINSTLIDNKSKSNNLYSGKVNLINSQIICNNVGNETNNTINNNSQTNSGISHRILFDSDFVFDLSKSNNSPSIFSINLPVDATGNFTVSVNGRKYLVSIVSGVATICIPNLTGNQNVFLAYSGDGKYSPLNKSANIKVATIIPNSNNPSENNRNSYYPYNTNFHYVKITAKKKTFKASKKTKKYSITLNSGYNPVKNVRVFLNIGKKTFKAKTNRNGKAIFKIKKLTKKRIYRAKIIFKGNYFYKYASKSVKIKIK